MEANEERLRTLEDIIKICDKQIHEIKKGLDSEYDLYDLLIDIANLYSTTIDCMKSKSKKRKCVVARDIYILLCVLIFGSSYDSIGIVVKRDRTTVFASISRSLIFWNVKDDLFMSHINIFLKTGIAKKYFIDFAKSMEIIQKRIGVNYGKIN